MTDEKDIYVVPVVVRVADREIETGYGQPWPEEKCDLAFYLGLAEKTGFNVIDQQKGARSSICGYRSHELSWANSAPRLQCDSRAW